MKSLIHFLLLIGTIQTSSISGFDIIEYVAANNKPEHIQSLNGEYEPPRDFFGGRSYEDGAQVALDNPDSDSMSHLFSNPAGCAVEVPHHNSPEEMLENVQNQLGEELNLHDSRVNWIWNGYLGSYVDVTDDPFAYEFEVNQFQFPFTYKGDRAVTIFIQNGFVVWFRSYGEMFRLLAVPLIPGVENSIWGDYAAAYWQIDGIPEDEFIVPVSKKLPCHWMIEEGYLEKEAIQEMFNLDWQTPDYLTAGRQYLASSCREAYRISQEKIGYWDATSMCGPLTWQIIHDANSFPYRIGNYDTAADLFKNANPRYWGTLPWIGFDPETYDLVLQTREPMAGYDFETKGNLYSGDILFSYGSPDQYSRGNGLFSHIFLVAGIDENNSRLTVTNMVKNHLGVKDCFIQERILYTPGDQNSGVIHYEWNNHGYGTTGKSGFDVFRWKWITYHTGGQSKRYKVRWGETVETIGFDWKISPSSILEANQLSSADQLIPGQMIILPAPTN